MFNAIRSADSIDILRDRDYESLHGGEVEARAEAACPAAAVPARWQTAWRRAKAERDARRGAARGAAGFKPYHALHVVMRIVPGVGSLRRRAMYKAVRAASITAALREWFRIVHISLQRTHVHMIVEAEDKAALSRGMQSFQISAARHINTALGDGGKRRRGSVFADRYHVEVITTPTRARHAISYVLSNWRKHGEDRDGLPSTWLVDPFSSAIAFPDWKELQDQAWMWPIRETYDPLMVRRPATWLLAEGWKLAGEISARAVPSQRR
ncbi:MAG TPA: transposase [Kofleriaceae bacterium]|nr:transposase [Kofleriaceae bacterium]